MRYEKGDDRVVTLTFDAPGAPVNTMTEAWKKAFGAAVERLQKDKDAIAGVILCSAKKTFFAGAELKEVLKFTAADGPRFFEEIEEVKRHFRALDKLGKPVVAALEGTALGGGWELALAAHCRICLNDERIELGLPEATLGLLPGASGVTKTVRLLGLQAALPMLMEGKTMRPQEAAKLGFLQGLAAGKDDLYRMAREWIAKNPAPKQPWDEENTRIPGGTPASPAISQMLTIAPAMLIEKTRGLYPAPEAIMAAAVEGASVDFDTALRIESRYLAKLAVGQVAKNLI
ncbi:MAG: enoyl-CoA hydratase-related protein, partial [Burkholderiales bacterium]